MTGEIGEDIDGDVKTTRGSKTGKKPENQNVTTKSENKTQVSENKAAENKKASQNERGDAEDGHKYSYDNLISKVDVKVEFLNEISDEEIDEYKSDKSSFASKMRDIARDVGNEKNTPTATYLHCEDLNEDVLITKESFKHGAERVDAAYILICKNISKILNNSIVVNELRPRDKTDGGYVLLGLVESEEKYIVVLVSE